MPSPTRWIAGWLVFRMLFAPSLQPPASAAPPRLETVAAACPARGGAAPEEPASCVEAVRADLVEGRIDLPAALARLEACASAGGGPGEDLARRAEIRLEMDRARLAFGAPPGAAPEEEALRTLSDRPVPPRAVATLRAAGISPAGFDPSVRSTILARLRGSAPLREAFREVFGPAMATDLDRLLDPADVAPPRALVLGGSVVVPGVAPAIPSALAPSLERPRASKEPRVLALSEYTAHLADGLYELEAARLRYLESTTASHRAMGSVRSFTRALRQPGRGDDAARAAGVRAAGDYAVLLGRTRDLELRLGPEPLLRRLIWGEVEAASRTARACEEIAYRRLDRIYAGAGVVAGLVGAAGVVVASGATGSLGGGLVIAAAVEASVAAYLIHRTERDGRKEGDEAPREGREPELPEPETRRFRPADRQAEIREGEEGDGQGEQEMAVEVEEGDDWLRGEGEGEGEDDDGEEETEPGPRENRIPPVLPPALPEALAELPPLLDPASPGERRELSLAEVQERLDEFLALEAPAPRERRAEPAPDLRDGLVEALIEEAKAALRLWEGERRLSAGFGDFFVRAELEEVPERRRPEVFAGAGARFAGDQALYRGSTDLDDLRRRIAARLVTHCRAEAAPGDLVQAACSDETALSILVVAALRTSGVPLPPGSVLGVQALGGRFHPVLFFEGPREVLSLMNGETVRGVAGPLYHPASFYYSYLVEHGVEPEIDPERHLLISLADPGMEPPVVECEEGRGRNVLGRMVDWLKSLVGAGMPSRRGSRCADDTAGWPTGDAGGDARAAGTEEAGEQGGAGGPSGAGGAAEARGERRGVSVSISGPRMPSPRSGGGQSGEGDRGAGARAGGARPARPEVAGRAAATRRGAEDRARGRAARRVAPRGRARGAERGPAPGGRAEAEKGRGAAAAREAGRWARGPAAPARARAPCRAPPGAGAGGGAGRGGGEAAAPDLGEVARETVAMRRKHEAEGALRVRPWRLRADYGYAAPSARVLFADNEQAMSRFGPEEPFITLSPSDDEAQRRMLEADSFPVFPAGTGCDADGLPPRRVLRRAAATEAGFRYLFCDQDESTVIFRARDDARSYAGLSAPDRPLFLVRLASERLRQLGESEEVAGIRAFLQDPDLIRGLSAEEMDSLAEAAGALLVFQQTLESALVQSMAELDEGVVRPHYYELHRQVIQGPLFVGLAAEAYRFNRRLASDPLQSLAWANSLPRDTRQGFFRLYYLLGSPVHWPARWEALGTRYGGVARAPSAAVAAPADGIARLPPDP